ncbi:MAG: hypothetical protein U1F26_01415 [Lysobacterales bacterium]
MKTIATLLCAVLLASASAAWAEASNLQPLIGSWSVDVERLPMPAEARPRSVTMQFAETADHRLSMRVVVIDPTGKELRAEGLGPLDGSAYPVEGNLEADSSAARAPAPGVLVVQLVRQGVPGSTRIYTVSADGQSMIETAANVGDDGKPYMRTHYFHRSEAQSSAP